MTAVTVGPTSVDALLARIASPGVLAGGGAAAALTGAAAAALVQMVAGVSARHASDDRAPAEIAAETDGLRRRLADLITLDALAYGRVLEARRRRDSGRPAALRDALVGAIEVPLELAAACVRILERCVDVLPFARPGTLADVGVACVLAGAALEAAILTARANLDGLDHPAFVVDAGRRLNGLGRRGAELRARLGQTFPDITPGADAAPR